MSWLTDKIALLDPDYLKQSVEKQSQLTKPVGSLGLLEEFAVRLAAMQKTDTPKLNNIWISIFAADHGVAEESVSAFPQSVTAAMVNNFINDGAAINVLSRHLNAKFEIIDVGIIQPIANQALISERAGNGTANFSRQAAMTEAQMQAALNSGQAAVARATQQHSELFIAGEMGIANTTSAIAAALTGLSIELLTGAGTGLKTTEISHKIKIIKQGLTLHQNFLEKPLNVLQYLGGFEIAALVGAFLSTAQHGLTVLIDGFIASVAALLAIKINPAVKEWFFYAHCSKEKGHPLLLQQMKARPVLDLNMRLRCGHCRTFTTNGM